MTEKNKLKIQIVKEMLERDKSDLSNYELNFEKFISRDDNINNLMEDKLRQQQ